MAIVATRPGSNGRARPSLGDQLDRLDGILNGLSEALNESVTAAVSAAVGQAVREAVESPTREKAARPAQTATFTDREESIGRKPRLRFLKEALTTASCSIALARRVTVRHFRRLGAPVVALLRRMKRAPRRFAALVFAGILTGAVAGGCGPVIGATLSGLAGFMIVLCATSEG